MHCSRRAASRADCTAGKSRAIRTAMIARTTSNSIRVKARRWLGRRLCDLMLGLLEEDRIGRRIAGDEQPLTCTDEAYGSAPKSRWSRRTARPYRLLAV